MLAKSARKVCLQVWSKKLIASQMYTHIHIQTYAYTHAGARAEVTNDVFAMLMYACVCAS